MKKLTATAHRFGAKIHAASRHRFVKDQSGAVLLLAALSLPILIGAAGLAVDTTIWYGSKRALQDATDSGALAGASEILRTGEVSAVISAGEVASLAEGARQINGGTLDVNHPPTSGPFIGAGDAVEVIATLPLQSFFAGIFQDAPSTVRSRSVAIATTAKDCVWALSPDAMGAVTVSGGAQVHVGCGIRSNSSHPEALVQSGTSCITAATVASVGGSSGSCISPSPTENVAPRPDPFADLQAPSYGPCDHTVKTKVNASDTAILEPGVYCAGIEVASGGNVQFQPGLYVLDGAGLSIGGSATVDGMGVSFYLTENSGTSDNVNISAGANVSLVAPEDGPLPGILFYHDRNAPDNVVHNLTGGSETYLEGIIYFPNSQVKISGGSSLDANKTLIIANTVVFTGNTVVGGIDSSVIKANPNLVTLKLVE